MRICFCARRQAAPACRRRALGGWRWPSVAARHATSRTSGYRVVVAEAAAPQALAASLPIEQHQEKEQVRLEAPPEAPQWAPPVGRPGLYDANGRLVLKCLTFPELEAWCASEGEEVPANRALQLWRWMYADPPAGSWVRRLEETRGRQNGFSAKFIDKVGSRVSLDGGLRLSQVVRAADGTRKLVFTLTEGEAAGGSVETVLIPIVRQQGLRDRLTICVSSQVGCAMNCQFCYTGRMGLLGNLTTAQIVEQVVEARRFLALEGDRTQLTNLVFMGMGEPLHNTEAVLAAAEIVSHYLGLHISHNKITISTVGLVPEMRSVIARSRVQMALSLHATTDEVRDWIVPVNRRYDLATLTAALEELFPKTQPHSKRHQQLAGGPSASSRDRPLMPHHHHQPENEHAIAANSSGAALGGVATAAAQASAAGSGSGSGSGTEAHTAGVGGSLHVVSGGEEGGAAPLRWLPPLGCCSQPHEAAEAPESVEAAGGHSDAFGNGGSSSGQSELPRSTLDNSCSSRHAELASSALPSSAPAAARDAAASDGSVVSSSDGGSSGASSSSGGRSLLVEYTMLHGINDTLEDAHRLADMLARVNCKVNLIVFNPHAGTRFQPSKDDDITAFRSTLVLRGLVCTIRDSRGDDEMAACGQLGNVGLAFRPSPILEAPERFRRFLLPPSSQAATPPLSRVGGGASVTGP